MHWITSVFGIIYLMSKIVAAAFPKYASVAQAIETFGLTGGLIAAADGKNVVASPKL